jgi:hypothetical protein
MYNDDEHHDDDCMRWHPQERANILSKMSFFWLIDLFKFTHNNHITANDIYRVRKCDASAKLSEKFSILWSHELSNGRNNLLRVVRQIYGTKVIIYGLIFSILDTTCR